MATYVTSDWHGYFNRAMDVLNKANFDENKDTLFVLGDIIDRGKHSFECCKWAYEKKEKVHFLLGNHEDMMLSVMGGYQYSTNIINSVDSSIWANNGGYHTYFGLIENWNTEKIIDFISWVREWPLFYDININGKRFILVHAGLALNGVRMSDDNYRYGRQDNVQIPGFKDQWAQTLLWIRSNWLYDLEDIPCDVVFGHTPTNYIYNNLVWAEEDLEYFAYNGLKIEGKPERILHINNKKHAIDTGREVVSLLRLDDMAEFYSDIPEEE